MGAPFKDSQMILSLVKQTKSSDLVQPWVFSLSELTRCSWQYVKIQELILTKNEYSSVPLKFNGRRKKGENIQHCANYKVNNPYLCNCQFLEAR